jgi:nitroimidazol reductase NimA-like FMN-containing flavoprotein (pyridoxamine 5'-phosphate oxidase superfamily)
VNSLSLPLVQKQPVRSPDTPEYQPQRAVAQNVLQRQGMWWEPGYMKTILHGTERPLVPAFYRINVGHITGHRATP